MSSPVRVSLTRFELHHAASVGLQRALVSWSRGDKDAHGYRGDGFEPHVVGAVAEYAAGKATGLHWSASVDTFGNEPDLAGNVEVRWSAKPRLIIRPKDLDRHPGWPYVLVTGRGYDYTVWGWMTPTEAAQPQWKDDSNGRPAAWFVPAETLRPTDQLCHSLTRPTGLV